MTEKLVNKRFTHFFMINPARLILILAPLLLALQAPVTYAQGSGKPASKPGTQKPKEKDGGAKPGKPEKATDKKKDQPVAPSPKKEEMVEVDGQMYTKTEKEKLDKGWRRLDYDWISPEDAPNIDKGLFKVNDKWVTLEEADTYHANDETPWIIPTRHFAFTSNVSRSEILRLSKHAEATYTSLKDMLGAEPKGGRLGVRIFNSVDTANAYGQEFAKDDKEANHSSVWLAYLGDGEKERPAVVLYDGPDGKGFAHLYMAHAAAHKFIDATFPDAATIPDWFVEGLATFCERWTDGALRNWALQQLIRRGAPDKLDKFESSFRLAADDPDGSQTRMQHAALVIAYYHFGAEKAEEATFKKALAALSKTGDARAAAINKLLEDSKGLEKKLKKYANL